MVACTSFARSSNSFPSLTQITPTPATRWPVFPTTRGPSGDLRSKWIEALLESNVLQVTGLCKRYGDREVVAGISFALEPW